MKSKPEINFGIKILFIIAGVFFVFNNIANAADPDGTQLGTDYYSNYQIGMYGDYVVREVDYRGSSENTDIYGYKISSGTSFPISNSYEVNGVVIKEKNPAIYGNTVVYEDYSLGTNGKAGLSIHYIGWMNYGGFPISYNAGDSYTNPTIWGQNIICQGLTKLHHFKINVGEMEFPNLVGSYPKLYKNTLVFYKLIRRARDFEYMGISKYDLVSKQTIANLPIKFFTDSRGSQGYLAAEPNTLQVYEDKVFYELIWQKSGRRAICMYNMTTGVSTQLDVFTQTSTKLNINGIGIYNNYIIYSKELQNPQGKRSRNLYLMNYLNPGNPIQITNEDFGANPVNGCYNPAIFQNKINYEKDDSSGISSGYLSTITIPNNTHAPVINGITASVRGVDGLSEALPAEPFPVYLGEQLFIRVNAKDADGDLLTFTHSPEKMSSTFMWYLIPPEEPGNPKVSQNGYLLVLPRLGDLAFPEGINEFTINISDGIHTITRTVRVDIKNYCRPRVDNEFVVSRTDTTEDNPIICDMTIAWREEKFISFGEVPHPNVYEYKIYYLDMRTGEKNSVPLPAEANGKEVVLGGMSKDWIIFKIMYASGNPIYAYNKKGKFLKYLGGSSTGHAYKLPVVGGDFAIWVNSGVPPTSEGVWCQNLLTNVATYIAGPDSVYDVNHDRLSTDGEYVVWWKYNYTTLKSSICYYKIGGAEGVQEILSDYVTGKGPKVSNGKIVWTCYKQAQTTDVVPYPAGTRIIKIYDIPTKRFIDQIGSVSDTNDYLSADIYGNTVVYLTNAYRPADPPDCVGGTRANYFDICKYEIGGSPQRLTKYALYDSSYWNGLPSIGLGGIAWTDERSMYTRDDIYLYPINSAPTISASNDTFLEMSEKMVDLTGNDDDTSAQLFFEFTQVSGPKTVPTTGPYAPVIIQPAPGATVGKFKWKPDSLAVGTYQFDLQVWDGPPGSAFRQKSNPPRRVTFTVQNCNVAPTVVLPSLPTLRITEGEYVKGPGGRDGFLLDFSDPNTDIGDAPTEYKCYYPNSTTVYNNSIPGLTFNTSTGEFKWHTNYNTIDSPVNGFEKQFTFNLSVKDSEGVESAKQPLTLTVVNKLENTAPELRDVPANTAIDEGQQFNFRLGFYDADGEGLFATNPYTCTPTNGAAGFNFDRQTGEFSWRPGYETVPLGGSKIFTFELSVKDTRGLESSKSYFALTVNDKIPKLEIILPTDPEVRVKKEGETFGEGNTFKVDVFSDTATNVVCSYKIDSGSWVPFTPPFYFTWVAPYLQDHDTHVYQVTFKAEADLPYQPDSKAVVLTVLDNDRPPVLDDPADVSGLEGEYISFMLHAADEDNDSLEYLIDHIEYPAGHIPTNSMNLTSAGRFSWQSDYKDGTTRPANNNDYLDYIIYFKTKEAGREVYSDIQSTKITINNINRNPDLKRADGQFLPNNMTIDEGGIDFNIDGKVFDDDYDTGDDPIEPSFSYETYTETAPGSGIYDPITLPDFNMTGTSSLWHITWMPPYTTVLNSEVSKNFKVHLTTTDSYGASGARDIYVTVNSKNQEPVIKQFAAVPDQPDKGGSKETPLLFDEIDTIVFNLQASDSDTEDTLTWTAFFEKYNKILSEWEEQASPFSKTSDINNGGDVNYSWNTTSTSSGEYRIRFEVRDGHVAEPISTPYVLFFKVNNIKQCGVSYNLTGEFPATAYRGDTLGIGEEYGDFKFNITNILPSDWKWFGIGGDPNIGDNFGNDEVYLVCTWYQKLDGGGLSQKGDPQVFLLDTSLTPGADGLDINDEYPFYFSVSPLDPFFPPLTLSVPKGPYPDGDYELQWDLVDADNLRYFSNPSTKPVSKPPHVTPIHLEQDDPPRVRIYDSTELDDVTGEPTGNVIYDSETPPSPGSETIIEVDENVELKLLVRGEDVRNALLESPLEFINITNEEYRNNNWLPEYPVDDDILYMPKYIGDQRPVAGDRSIFVWKPGYCHSLYNPDTQVTSPYTVTFPVVDRAGNIVEAKIKIKVNNIDRAPAIETSGLEAVAAGERMEFVITAGDPDICHPQRNIITEAVNNLEADNLPAGATLTPLRARAFQMMSAAARDEEVAASSAAGSSASVSYIFSWQTSLSDVGEYSLLIRALMNYFEETSGIINLRVIERKQYKWIEAEKMDNIEHTIIKGSSDTSSWGRSYIQGISGQLWKTSYAKFYLEDAYLPYAIWLKLKYSAIPSGLKLGVTDEPGSFGNLIPPGTPYPSPDGLWHWVKVVPEISVEKGQYALSISSLPPDVKVDSIFITNDLEYIPIETESGTPVVTDMIANGYAVPFSKTYPIDKLHSHDGYLYLTTADVMGNSMLWRTSSLDKDWQKIQLGQCEGRITDITTLKRANTNSYSSLYRKESIFLALASEYSGRYIMRSDDGVRFIKDPVGEDATVFSYYSKIDPYYFNMRYFYGLTEFKDHVFSMFKTFGPYFSYPDVAFWHELRILNGSSWDNTNPLQLAKGHISVLNPRYYKDFDTRNLVSCVYNENLFVVTYALTEGPVNDVILRAFDWSVGSGVNELTSIGLTSGDNSTYISSLEPFGGYLYAGAVSKQGTIVTNKMFKISFDKATSTFTKSEKTLSEITQPAETAGRAITLLKSFKDKLFMVTSDVTSAKLWISNDGATFVNLELGLGKLQQIKDIEMFKDDIYLTVKKPDSEWTILKLNFKNYVFVDGNISVSGDGTVLSPYKTIQEGIDNAGLNQTVYIMPGTYNEAITARDGMILKGHDKNSTIVESQNEGTGIGVTLNSNTGIEISNLTFKNYLYGVKAENCSQGNIKIHDNIFTRNGIFDDGSAAGDGAGVYILNCTDQDPSSNENILSNNDFNDNALFGIKIENSEVAVIGNHFTDEDNRMSYRWGELNMGSLQPDPTTDQIGISVAGTVDWDININNNSFDKGSVGIWLETSSISAAITYIDSNLFNGQLIALMITGDGSQGIGGTYIMNNYFAFAEVYGLHCSNLAWAWNIYVYGDSYQNRFSDNFMDYSYELLLLLDSAPAFYAIGDQEFIEGESRSFTVYAVDYDGDLIQYHAKNLPPGAVFDEQNRTFTWENPGPVGTYPNVIFEARDPYKASEEIVTMTVKPTPDYINFEAEDVNNLKCDVIYDAASDAWGGAYIDNEAFTQTSSHTFYVPHSGTYYIWARMKAKSGTGYLRLNLNGDPQDKLLLSSGGWSWSNYDESWYPGVCAELQEGKNIIYIKQNEPGESFVYVDSIFITDRVSSWPAYYSPPESLKVVSWQPITINGLGASENYSSKIASYKDSLYVSTSNSGHQSSVYKSDYSFAFNKIYDYAPAMDMTLDMKLLDIGGNYSLYSITGDGSGNSYIAKSSDGASFAANLIGNSAQGWWTKDITSFNEQAFAGFYNSSSLTFAMKKSTNPMVNSNWVNASLTGNINAEASSLFKGYLYVGTNSSTGAQIWRTNNGVSWTNVATAGFGDAARQKITAMADFGGYLYAALAKNGAPCKIYRSSTGDLGNWVEVISNGFGNEFYSEVSSMKPFMGRLYIGVSIKKTSEEVLSGAIYSTQNGTNWEMEANNGILDGNNISIADFEVFKGNLYLTTSNSYTGTQLIKGNMINSSVEYPFVYGYVVDDTDSSAISNALITLYNHNKTVILGIAKTDIDGNYKIYNKNLTPGSYTMTASKVGYRALEKSSNLSSDYNNYIGFNLVPTSNAPVFDPMETSITITNTENCSFTIYASDRDNDELSFAIESFTPAMPAGVTFVNNGYIGDGYYQATFDWQNADPVGTYTVRFSVTDGVSTVTSPNVIITVRPIVLLTGGIYDSADWQPVSGATIKLYNQDKSILLGTAVSQASGYYEIPGTSLLTPYSYYHVSVEKSGFSSIEQNVYLYQNSYNYREFYLISGGDSNVPPEFKYPDPPYFEVQKGSSVSFTITATDDDGDALTYSSVSLPAGASFNPVTRVFTWSNAGPAITTYQAVFSVTDGVNPAVTLTVDIKVNPVKILSGYIYDEFSYNHKDGSWVPIVGADVRLYNKTKTTLIGSAIADSEGYFEIYKNDLIVPDDYIVYVTKGGNVYKPLEVTEYLYYDSDNMICEFLERYNNPPIFGAITPINKEVIMGETLTFNISATDEDTASNLLLFGIEASCLNGLDGMSIENKRDGTATFRWVNARPVGNYDVIFTASDRFNIVESEVVHIKVRPIPNYIYVEAEDMDELHHTIGNSSDAWGGAYIDCGSSSTNSSYSFYLSNEECTDEYTVWLRMKQKNSVESYYASISVNEENITVSGDNTAFAWSNTDYFSPIRINLVEGKNSIYIKRNDLIWIDAIIITDDINYVPSDIPPSVTSWQPVTVSDISVDSSGFQTVVDVFPDSTEYGFENCGAKLADYKNSLYISTSNVRNRSSVYNTPDGKYFTRVFDYNRNIRNTMDLKAIDLGAKRNLYAITLDNMSIPFITDIDDNFITQRIQPFNLNWWFVKNIIGFREKAYTGFSKFTSSLIIGKTGDPIYQPWINVTNSTFSSYNNITIEASCIFKGYLYIGTYNEARGAQIWKTSDGVTWESVILDGFGDTARNRITSMATFGGQIFVATMKYGSPGSIYKSNDGSSGNWHQAALDGFGNMSNTYVNCMKPYMGKLYVTTVNPSGCAIYSTKNGTDWQVEVTNGIVGATNTAVDDVAIFKGSLFITTYNNQRGARLIKGVLIR